MRNHVAELRKDHEITCQGKEIADLSRSQKSRRLNLPRKRSSRRLKELKSRAQHALYLMELFGLEITALSVKDKCKSSYVFDFAGETQTKRETPSSYAKLSDDERAKVEEVLYLLDHFCVGDDFYQQLTMTEGGKKLPRGYKVKRVRNAMNAATNIMPTPGKTIGAQHCFTEKLVEHIRPFVSICNMQLRNITMYIPNTLYQLTNAGPFI